jgi:hypothetical protein
VKPGGSQATDDPVRLLLELAMSGSGVAALVAVALVFGILVTIHLVLTFVLDQRQVWCTLPHESPVSAELDEPVRRYFAHALGPGPAPGPGPGTQLVMTGRIKVRLWLPFRAVWDGDGRRLWWRADVGPGRLRILRVHDCFTPAGSMDVRLLGRLPLVHAQDEDTARSAAGRAAVESAMWSPASLLPERGVQWQAEADDVIVASWEVPPERPQVRLRIDSRGAIRSAWVRRWDNGDHGLRGYIPCGGHVHAERSFGGLTIPTRVIAGWWFGTPRFAPFFEAEIVSAEHGRRQPPTETSRSNWRLATVERQPFQEERRSDRGDRI